MSYKRYDVDVDRYGFPTGSYGGCGDLEEASGGLEMTRIVSAFSFVVILLSYIFFTYGQIKKLENASREMTQCQKELLDEADRIFRVVVFQVLVCSSIVLYFLTSEYPENQYRNFFRSQLLPIIGSTSNLWLIYIPIRAYLIDREHDDRVDISDNVTIPSLLDLPMLGPVFNSTQN